MSDMPILETWRMPAVSETLLAKLSGNGVFLRGLNARTVQAGASAWDRIDLEHLWIIPRTARAKALECNRFDVVTFAPTSPESGFYVYPTNDTDWQWTDTISIEPAGLVERVEIVSLGTLAEAVQTNTPSVMVTTDFGANLWFAEARCISIQSKTYGGRGRFTLRSRPLQPTDYAANQTDIAGRPARDFNQPTANNVETPANS